MEQGVYSRGGGHGDVLTMQNDQDYDEQNNWRAVMPKESAGVRFESLADKTKGTLLRQEAQFGEEHFETYNKKYSSSNHHNEQQEVEIEANDASQLKY